MLNAQKSLKSLGGFLLAIAFLTGLAGNCFASIRFEHIALNVDNPKKVADWYVENMGLKIVSQNKKMIFLSDPDGNLMFELYNKKEAKDSYSDLNHASSHVAFASDNAESLAKKLIAGGASQLKKWKNPVGETIINMRDPWGNMIQIVQRIKPKL